MLDLLLLIASLVCLGLAAVGFGASRVNLFALGMFLFVLRYLDL